MIVASSRYETALGSPMPSTNEQPMIASSARNRLLPASGMMAAGTPVPMPVRETSPMMMPTHAAAATRGVPPIAVVRTSARILPPQRFTRRLIPTSPTINAARPAIGASPQPICPGNTRWVAAESPAQAAAAAPRESQEPPVRGLTRIIAMAKQVAMLTARNGEKPANRSAISPPRAPTNVRPSRLKTAADGVDAADEASSGGVARSDGATGSSRLSSIRFA